MGLGNRLLSTAGARRTIGALGVLYVAIAAGRALVRLDQGAPLGNVLVVTLLIAGPGVVLVYGSRWISRADIDARFYPGVAGWCLAGFGAMAAILLLFHLQPEDAISSPTTSPPILTALSSAAGLTVGVHDARAKTRAHTLEQRNRELHQTQVELEEAVGRLEESNERLDRYRAYTGHVLDTIPDIFYVLDDDALQRWNESLCEVTGYSDAEISTMTPPEFVADDDREMVADAVAEGFETGSLQVEAALVTRDGTEMPYEFVGSTLETPDGELVLAGIGRDVTDRKERERALEIRARQQRAMADLSQLALQTDDLDELMHEAARRVAAVLDNEYCKVLDLDDASEELLLRQGVGWDDGLVGEATVSAIEADSQAAYTLANDHPVVVEELETETRFSGPELLTSHDVRSGISTIIGPFDEPWGILGTHDTDGRTYIDEDVIFVQSVANVLAEAIERQQYREELEQLVTDLEESNDRLERFAYAASHDLQEPLRMVSSYLQLIERRYEDDLDAEGREFLEFAIDGADRMRSMIAGLLEYSRVEAGANPLEPTDLETVLEGVREDLQVTITGSDATIAVDSLPRVEGDPDQLRQVFQNLLENAIEYSGDEPPDVHVSARRNGTDWILSVHDEGVGIDPDDQERVFDVFQRAHGRNVGDGTGIGLALCERIVERHGGEIWVDSEPGEGTTFSFTLPAVERRDE